MNDLGNAQRWADAERHLAALDADWANLVATVGPCLLEPGALREPWQALVRAVAYQQLHGRAAEAIFGRFLALYDDGFPTSAQLLATEPDAMRACGFSARKVDTIRGIAEGAASGLVPERAQACAMDDEALVARLVTLRGIGRWTVEMMLMFTLDRTDVLPADDFGVRDGYRRLRSLDALPTPRRIAQMGEPWRPWRSAASWYLWRVPR
ncbi:MAG TPA: DNA-3-methyladenine glycosylase [Methyloversatilis sp.]